MFASKIVQVQSKVGEATRNAGARRAGSAHSGDQDQEADATFAGSPHGLSWDFGKIAVSHASRIEPLSPRGAHPGLLQAKLVVGPADDPLEREADAVADQVMRIPGPVPAGTLSAGDGLQRKCAQCEEDDEAKGTLRRRSIDPPHIESSVPVATPEVERVLCEPGRPLGGATRAFFEPRFGWDFSSVRVHTGSQAERAAGSVNARAFAVGEHLVFGAGAFAPDAGEGRRLIAHELAHVVQQSGGTAPSARGAGPAIRRKIILKGTEMDAKARQAFIKAHKWTSARRAAAIMQDMAEAGDSFDFADEHELQEELVKRSSTVEHMEESQESVEKIPGDKRSAFGYPFSGASALYGPRVNYAARKYWEPAVPDSYARRTDKAKNRALLALPRHERCKVYGDQCGLYGWKLTADGEKDPYHAIAHLFAPQPPHLRTLIHCDYLISLVNMMSLADAIGASEFNKRVAAFGAGKLTLKYNAFEDLHEFNWERTAGGAWVKTPGLRSAQRIAPSSEADLVIGDHVVFFNHLAYDLINQNVGNAWRLENAVLVSRDHGKDVFLGHGSGHLTSEKMREKLAEEYNIVARQAIGLTDKASSRNKATSDAALAGLKARFPNVKNVSGHWRIQGAPGLCAAHPVDVPLRLIKPTEVLGPRDPCDPTRMYVVERPIESAKGRAP